LAGTAHAEARESREATVILLGWGPAPSLAASRNLAEMEASTLPVALVQPLEDAATGHQRPATEGAYNSAPDALPCDNEGIGSRWCNPGRHGPSGGS
jgi:hypothetical protein